MKYNHPKSPNWMQDEKAYWPALGRFVHAFARLEGTLFYAFREMAQMTHPIAKALFSGLRPEAALQNMGRLLEIGNESEELKAELKDVFSQITHINNARNSILHHGWNYSSAGEMVSGNYRTALTPSRLKEFPASPEIIDDMSADLQKINSHLIAYITRNATHPDVLISKTAHEAEKQKPWRYKPPAQPSQNVQRPSKTPKRPLQPPSSPK